MNLIVGDGHQGFGEFTYYADSGDYIGFDGKKVTKAGFVKTKDNHWYYLDGKGKQISLRSSYRWRTLLLWTSYS